MGAAFQPIWDLRTRRVLGYEGLARPAPEDGLPGPADAFAAALRLGRVDELDAQYRAAILARVAGFPAGALLFVNAAPHVLDHGTSVAQALQEEVEAAGLRPHQVVIELTEHASDRMDRVIDQIRQLRDLGFRLALDDVGAGDTGLGLLAKVRPDYIKLDRHVLACALAGGPGRGVLAAVVAYAGAVGSDVIAEGIETEEMLELVQNAQPPTSPARITARQGYLLGRPSTRPPWHDLAPVHRPASSRPMHLTTSCRLAALRPCSRCGSRPSADPARRSGPRRPS